MRECVRFVSGRVLILGRDRMAKFSRDKGKRGEREVVDLLAEEGLDAYREAALQAGEVEGAADVRIRQYPELAVEVKRRESYAVPEWQRQVEEAHGDAPYVIAYRKSGKPRHPEPWRAIVDLRWLARVLADLDRLRRMTNREETSC